jgi:ketosteroid isomerase-like protein
MRSIRIIALVIVLFVLGGFIAFRAVSVQMKSGTQNAAQATNTQQQVEKLIKDFLVGAGSNDPAAHDRFWSDDLVYTSAAGVLKTKADIMKSVREAASKPPDPKESKATYTAEDVMVHDYGDFAVANFRLAANLEEAGKRETLLFRNTGTFRKENGEWKVIAWQATKIEPPKSEEKK